jgi:hypothetical protein
MAIDLLENVNYCTIRFIGVLYRIFTDAQTDLCMIFTFLVRFEVFTEVTMKNGVFWDVMPCGHTRATRRNFPEDTILHCFSCLTISECYLAYLKLVAYKNQCSLWSLLSLMLSY